MKFEMLLRMLNGVEEEMKLRARGKNLKQAREASIPAPKYQTTETSEPLTKS